jgi:hypothetical protein
LSQQINLYTPALRGERRASTAMLLAATAIVVAGTALTGAYEHSQLRKTEAEASAVAQTLKEAQARYDKQAAERAGRAPDAAREAELLGLLAQLKRREQIVDALKSGAIGSSAGFSEVMRALSRQSLSGVWLTGFDIDAGGKDLTLSGRALGAELVPRYVERLNREPVMQGRQFASLKIDQPAQPEAATPAPAAKETPAQKARAPLLRFVEFSMSTSGRDADAPPKAASTPPPLPEIPAAPLIDRKPAPAPDVGKPAADGPK